MHTHIQMYTYNVYIHTNVKDYATGAMGNKKEIHCTLKNT